MIKAVIFDMDGLLINSEPFWQESETIVFNSLGVATGKELFETLMGKRIDEVVDIMWNIQNWNSKTKSEVVEDIVTNVIRLVKKREKHYLVFILSLKHLSNHPLKLVWHLLLK